MHMSGETGNLSVKINLLLSCSQGGRDLIFNGGEGCAWVAMYMKALTWLSTKKIELAFSF